MNFKTVSLFALASAFCFAESFNGKLVDVSCVDQNKAQPKTDQLKVMACSPTAATKSFGVETKEGKILKLDAAGNMKAASILKDASKPDVDVTVNGTASGESLKVESISAQ